MFQNSKRIGSELFTVGIGNIWIFLDLPFSFSPPGIKDLDFIPCVMWAFSADSLTWACGNGALLSIYTALFLHKDLFLLLEEVTEGPRFLSLLVFAFAQIGVISLEVTMAAGTTLLTFLLKGLLDGVMPGLCLCGFISLPTGCTYERGHFKIPPHILSSTF